MASTISVKEQSAPDRSRFWSGSPVAGARSRGPGLQAWPDRTGPGPLAGTAGFACRTCSSLWLAKLPVAPLAVFGVRGRVGGRDASPRARAVRRRTPALAEIRVGLPQNRLIATAIGRGIGQLTSAESQLQPGLARQKAATGAAIAGRQKASRRARQRRCGPGSSAAVCDWSDRSR